LGGWHAWVLPSSGLALGAGVDWSVLAPLSLHLTGLFAPPVESELGGRRAETLLVGGRALGCLGLDLGQLGLAGCGGVASGAAFASGLDFEDNLSATMGWVAAVLGLSATFPTREWLAVRLAADGFGNLVQPRLRVVGRDQDQASGRDVGALVSLALVLALP
jgi:hypothetical protein